MSSRRSRVDSASAFASPYGRRPQRSRAIFAAVIAAATAAACTEPPHDQKEKEGNPVAVVSALKATTPGKVADNGGGLATPSTADAAPAPSTAAGANPATNPGKGSASTTTATATATATGMAAGSIGASAATTFSSQHDGYSCSCVEQFRGGASRSVASCDTAETRCPDVSLLVDCQEDPNANGCDYLVSCECDCTALQATKEFEHGPFEDVVLTGVPDLWQFNFMCGTSTGANAVGCGPVAAAMLLYYWAQRGYDGLVDRFLVGAGAGPAERDQDWQALVRELRANYLDGGICVPFGGGQYATLMGKMTTGIGDYITDAGYNAHVEHHKVCADCAANGADEMSGGAGLALIKAELEAGRPVIMGFNSGRALDVSVPVYNDGAWETVYVGELSNGVPIAGTIDHYAVITGYRRISGLDVLTLNLGWNDETTDQNVSWNPGGKWLHLYTVDITDRADGPAWCSIDRGVDDDGNPPTADAFSQPYIEISHVERSTPTTTNQLTALAGRSCGIAREGETVTYTDTTHERVTCPLRLPSETGVPLEANETSTGHDSVGGSYGPPIVDWIPPP